jgi:hypothetical protein
MRAAWDAMTADNKQAQRERFAVNDAPGSRFEALASKVHADQFDGDPDKYAEALEVAGQLRPDWRDEYVSGDPYPEAVPSLTAESAAALLAYIGKLTDAQRAALTRRLVEVAPVAVREALEREGHNTRALLEAVNQSLQARLSPGDRTNAAGKVTPTHFSDNFAKPLPGFPASIDTSDEIGIYAIVRGMPPADAHKVLLGVVERAAGDVKIALSDQGFDVEALIRKALSQMDIRKGATNPAPTL